ncbi:uncharacterized protein [Antedon mediterranea]|uniref:uncharacterized protein isoform X1 n=1 Tax=Antedon mediterranea TaxID=105859 RepID=UPI003AF5B7C5
MDVSPLISQPPREPSIGGHVYQYDPTTAKLVSSIPAVHKSSQTLTRQLYRTTAELSQHVECLRRDLHGNISYEQFMADMLSHNEIMLAKRQFMPYDYITFEILSTPNFPVVAEKKNMTQGRILLTNRRMIMLTNESTRHQRTEVVAFPPGAKKPDKYFLKCEVGDTFHYQFLPLKNVRTVEVDAMFGASMSTYINSQEVCWPLNMLSWFGHAMCLKNWKETDRSSNPSLNQRILKLSVDLPPWGNPCIITIYVNPTTHILLVKDFLCDLQAYGPAMELETCQKHC